MNRSKLFVIVSVFSAPMVLALIQYSLSSSLSELTTPLVLAMPSPCGRTCGAAQQEAGERLDHDEPGNPKARLFHLIAPKGVAEDGVIVRTDAVFDVAGIVECGCRRFRPKLTCCVQECEVCVLLVEPWNRGESLDRRTAVPLFRIASLPNQEHFFWLRLCLTHPRGWVGGNCLPGLVIIPPWLR